MRRINPFLAALVVFGLAGCGGQFVNLDKPQRSGSNDPPQRIGADGKPRHSSDDDTPGAPSRLLGKLGRYDGLDEKRWGGAGRAEPAYSLPRSSHSGGAEASQAYADTPPSGANLRYHIRSPKRSGREADTVL
jgi:hypothetical protein